MVDKSYSNEQGGVYNNKEPVTGGLNMDEVQSTEVALVLIRAAVEELGMTREELQPMLVNLWKDCVRKINIMKDLEDEEWQNHGIPKRLQKTILKLVRNEESPMPEETKENEVVSEQKQNSLD